MSAHMPMPTTITLGTHPIPTELIHEITFRLATSNPHGPPPLLPLLLTSRALHSSTSHPHLLARVFKFKFDDGAIARRAYAPRASDLAAQLVHYCGALKTLRRGDVHHEDAEEAMWRAWVMMLENDGRNRAQLEWAGAEGFVENYVLRRLGEGREGNDGWPVGGLGEACAAWLMWMFTTREKLLKETPAQREHIVSLLLPFVLNPYRYPSAHAPPSHYTLPLTSTSPVPAHSIPTLHGPYPIYPSALITTPHYNAAPTLSAPLITTAAKLLYLSRREVIPFGIPPHLPENRAEAQARGVEGPTKDDMREVNGYMAARPPARVVWDWVRGARVWEEAPRCLYNPPPPPEGGEPSEVLDCEWWRLRMCYDPFRPLPRIRPATYTPGSLTGLWQGRLLIPSETALNALLHTGAFPARFTEPGMMVTTQPIFMRLEELLLPSSPSVPIPTDAGEGMQNAWFPGPLAHVSFHPSSSSEVEVRAGGESRRYQRWRAGHCGDREGCTRCREREEALERVRREEGVEDERVRRVFESVGLGLSSPPRTRSPSPSSDSEDPSEDSDSEDDDEEEYEPDDDQHSPRRNIPACNGVQEVVLRGNTDPRHAHAWNEYEFYGRVRGWDGLVGILRMARYPAVNHVLFYGYIINGRNFVGNWRVAGADPSMPAWESAVVMSRREGE